MIKAIVFDCFGVLTTDMWLAFVDQLPEGKDSKELHDTHKAYNRGIISQKEFHQRLKALTGQDFEDSLEISGNGTIKNNRLLGYIGELRKRGYKIGLLSNVASNWINEEFLSGDERRLLDAMVLSYEVGMTKPDPRIFRLVCDRLGVETGEAVMIDDIEMYCSAATEEGMRAIKYADFSDMKNRLEVLLDDSDR